MRPNFAQKTLDENCGQEKIVEIFKNFLKNEKIPHSIFYGVAGCGKTSFARVIANEIRIDFIEFDGGEPKIETFRTILKNHQNSLTKPLFS